jgi:hypothetical protein
MGIPLKTDQAAAFDLNTTAPPFQRLLNAALFSYSKT